MTATQFTGGSYKHVDPSNYATGKTGAEVTIHWSIADGASIEEQTTMGERARVEAIRLAMGADKPYQQPEPAAVPFVAAQPATPAASAPISLPPVSSVTAPVAVSPPAPVTEPVVPPTPAPAPISTSSGPLSVPGATAAPAAVTSAPDVSTTSPSPASVITDEALREAATHHQSRILNAAPKDPVSQETAGRQISVLIAEYVTPPKSLYTLSQEKRQEFLDRLAALGA